MREASIVSGPSTGRTKMTLALFTDARATDSRADRKRHVGDSVDLSHSQYESSLVSAIARA